ncbi:histidinol phosphatase [Maribacter confluentis]|uniref:protein-tyrosine-phosphatase n=1 Tax=Maribacter confluentis TaxID=1656093 RepID=A0ABT8RV67_9FLAO|nr:CpsB/CapC family capsule biosynthesis tyrosine phosphatase [Maribacter confluentis]MDO1514334.1 histidinol phosphatase [Maribacter confluentis]
MFSFFTKKHFLIDHLEGFIDIHNHILPGIDDGAKSVEDSIKLIKGFNDFGVTDFICTPHIMENYYPNDPTTINKAQLLLKNGLKMNGLDHVNIDVAAEHMIDSGFEKLMDDKKMMPLAKNYLLIEMSYLQASINFNQAVSMIKQIGFHPILAHPERYAYLTSKKNIYAHYKSEGIFFQLNMLSLGALYGSTVQKTAFKLLEDQKFDFLASDVHHINHINELKNIKVKTKHKTIIESLVHNTNYHFLH